MFANEEYVANYVDLGKVLGSAKLLGLRSFSFTLETSRFKGENVSVSWVNSMHNAQSLYADCNAFFQLKHVCNERHINTCKRHYITLKISISHLVIPISLLACMACYIIKTLRISPLI